MVKVKRDAKGRFTGNGSKQQSPLLTNREAALLLRQVMSVNAVRSIRSGSYGGDIDPRRDLNDECGFPITENITSQDYQDLYDREGIACRVVEVMPKESWSVCPIIKEVTEAEEDTPFEKAWDEAGAKLRGNSFYNSKSDNPVWQYLERVDILSGIGPYGVLLLGFNDGKELSEEVEPKEGMALTFLRPFSATQATITAYETETGNPRYGQPAEYQLTFDNPHETGNNAGQLSSMITEDKVHWTRVIHVADNLGSSEIWGTPRMQPVFNYLLNLRKLYGGSAEMYWKGAFPGYSIETNPNLPGEIEIDLAQTKEEIEKLFNGLQRWMALQDVSAKSLAPQVVDPTPQIDTQLEAICVRLATPKRIFTGSERGELASSQDIRTWNGRVMGRQRGYLTPRLIVPLIDRLIYCKVLPQPVSYDVEWPDLNSLTPEEQATIAVHRTEALAKYVMGGVEALVPPSDFLIRVLGFEPEDAEEIIEAAIKTTQDEMLSMPKEDNTSPENKGEDKEQTS